MQCHVSRGRLRTWAEKAINEQNLYKSDFPNFPCHNSGSWALPQFLKVDCLTHSILSHVHSIDAPGARRKAPRTYEFCREYAQDNVSERCTDTPREFLGLEEGQQYSNVLRRHVIVADPLIRKGEVVVMG